MKNCISLILISCLLLFSNVNAHPSFFAFAEVEYKEMNNSIEATIITSTHDLEHVLKNKGIISSTLAKVNYGEKEYEGLNEYLNQHFSIFTSDSMSLASQVSKSQTLQLKLEGFEVLLNGDVEFYLSAKMISPFNQVNIMFDLLMDQIPEQQNKLTFKFRDSKSTYNYLTNNRIQLIQLRA